MSNAIDDLDELGDDGDDDAKLYVADPDDYAKTRKLKALSDAKAEVRKVRNNQPNTASRNEWQGIHARLADSVASYGHELLPLLKAAEEAGKIHNGDYFADGGYGKTDVRVFIKTDGQLETPDGDDFETPPPHMSMLVYRHLQTLERKLGLGLSLEEDTDDEWEL
jgi:hypothetical protein